MPESYIRKILEADIYDLAIESPMDTAPNLSRRLHCPVLLKREDLQPVFSFKIRGAYNKIKRLDTESLEKGIIAASAGNHAQGVAMAAAHLGITAQIVMSVNTPSIKVQAVKQLGARVLLQGDSYDEAAAFARHMASDKNLVYVPPYDDPDVIAGQGTIGMEIMRQRKKALHAVFVPVGGGGLIAGIGAYVKYLDPKVKVIGVEAEGSACLWAALKAGRRVSLPAETLDQFADGTAVCQVGKEPFRLARKYVDEVIRVNTDEICAAIKDVFEDTRSIPEPSGALSVAGMKRYVESQGAINGSLVAVISGANMNFDRLRHVSERTEIGEKREILLSVAIPEKPGSFKQFCRAVGKRNITEFNYRYGEPEVARVLVGIQTNEQLQDRRALISKLGKNYDVTDLTGNELAVLHIRHMVGGHLGQANTLEGVAVPERVFRFEFPEKPGALLRFLSVLGDEFNISLFHYRNHGAAYGRVLTGIQVPDEAMKKFKRYLDQIGYRYWEETDNPAYEAYLGRL
ncbi:MAG: threonine ammonia-lyase, biosynthetic [Gammaproteobacteria bacterium]|nr:threonine ammonia-lyase, biosynthetic [Gammaproteobacteria bacterium]